MLLITQLAFFFLIFVIIYIILRAILIYTLYLFLTRIFNAKVRFKSGYSFFSIQDIRIESDQLEIECKLFMISVGVHTSMQIRKLLIKKGSIHHFKEVYLDAQRIVDRALPSKRFFHISIDVDNISFQTENFELSMDNIHSIHTDTQHTLTFRNCNFSNPLLSIKVSEYSHSVHFSGNLPEKIQIMRPIFNIKCDANTISSEYIEVSAYSEVPSIWRAAISLQETELTFPNITFVNDIFTIKFSHQIIFSIVDSLITFESLHIRNYLHQFKIKVNQVKLSHNKIKVKKIIGNSDVQFLRILNHLKWLLYASCKIKKIELLIKLDNGELLDIIVLNFEEHSKLDENNDENRRINDLNLDSEENNFKYFNIFNSYVNSFNKHNIKLSEGEALITNPSEIANGFHSGNLSDRSHNTLFDRQEKEFVKADEVKMEMVAHRTLISSVHMSDIQINIQDVSQFSLNSLDVIYSNSETFQLYCQELYDGFSEKLTQREHNIQALIKSLRIDELVLSRTLTSENLDLKIVIDKSVPLEESRKSLKSLFPKIADLSKIKSVILTNFDMKCSSINYTQTFSATRVNYSGKMALFHNGTKLLTCGVIHCISETAAMPIETFFSPAFWYVSFESAIFKIRYENKKAVFKAIKGDQSAFTFERSALFQDIIQLKRQKPKGQFVAQNNNSSMTATNVDQQPSNLTENFDGFEDDDDDLQIAEGKSVSIFDFWTDNIIPIGPEKKVANNQSSASNLSFIGLNDSSFITNNESDVNLQTDTNLNLSLNLVNNSNQNVLSSIQKPKTKKKRVVSMAPGMSRISSQFDFEDSMFRPSQHVEKNTVLVNTTSSDNFQGTPNRKNRQTFKIFMPSTDQVRNSVKISPKMNSEYVQGSLFDSSASFINLGSNASSLTNKKAKISNYEYDQNRPDSPLVSGQLRKIDSSKNIPIGELKGEMPFFEPVRYKFECFNGEYFANSTDETVEFKTEKAVFGEVQYTNVTAKFEKQVPMTFVADQIEWPYMKAFFTEFVLPNRLFKAKSMSLNSNFALSSLDPKWLSLSHADIGQMLFKGMSFDEITINNPNSIPGQNKSSKQNEITLEAKTFSINAEKLTFRAFNVKIPLLSTRAEVSANLIRLTLTNAASFVTFLRDLNTQFKKVISDKIILKLKPAYIPRINNNKIYSNHLIVFKNADFNFSRTNVTVIDISSRTMNIARIDRKIIPTSKVDTKEPDNNQKTQNKKDINKEKFILLTAKPDDEKRQSPDNQETKQQFKITMTIKEKEKEIPAFIISLNSLVIVKCNQRDVQLFKEAFDSIFQIKSREEAIQYVFKSMSLCKFNLSLKYYNPNDRDFNDDREYLIAIDQAEISKQTKSFHDIFLFLFNYVMNIVRNKVAKKREIAQNGSNYA